MLHQQQQAIMSLTIMERDVLQVCEFVVCIIHSLVLRNVLGPQFQLLRYHVHLPMPTIIIPPIFNPIACPAPPPLKVLTAFCKLASRESGLTEVESFLHQVCGALEYIQLPCLAASCFPLRMISVMTTSMYISQLYFLLTRIFILSWPLPLPRFIRSPAG